MGPRGKEPGLKSCTDGSVQYGPFVTQFIPDTENKAPYILDGRS